MTDAPKTGTIMVGKTPISYATVDLSRKEALVFEEYARYYKREMANVFHVQTGISGMTRWECPGGRIFLSQIAFLDHMEIDHDDGEIACRPIFHEFGYKIGKGCQYIASDVSIVVNGQKFKTSDGVVAFNILASVTNGMKKFLEEQVNFFNNFGPVTATGTLTFAMPKDEFDCGIPGMLDMFNELEDNVNG